MLNQKEFETGNNLGTLQHITLNVIASSYETDLNEIAKRLFIGVAKMFDDILTSYDQAIVKNLSITFKLS